MEGNQRGWGELLGVVEHQDQALGIAWLAGEMANQGFAKTDVSAKPEAANKAGLQVFRRFGGWRTRPLRCLQRAVP